MAHPGKPKFLFTSKALPEDTFHVVRFRGTEGLSETYHFDITLVSAKPDVDLTEVLGQAATFTIQREDGAIPFHGALAYFEQLQQAGGMYFYRAELVPRLWKLIHTQHNQIFLDKAVKDFLSAVLQDGGLSPGQDLEFKVQGDPPAWDYVCQYNESHYNFACRWMEREGIYFYFDQSPGVEKMVLTDMSGAHAAMPEGEELVYSPVSGLETAHLDEVVSAFMLRQQPMPKSVRLKDYNPDTPSLDIEGTAQVSDRGQGEIYIYGEHYRTPSEASRLAKIRAQEVLCREKLFTGVSSVPYVRTGYVFTLKRHYREDFNQRYLTVAATHEGSQEAYLTAGLGLRLTENQDRLYYRNSFTCIPAVTQFRPERKTPLARFQGTLSAKIDAGGSGQYAELDEHGRYKVVLPLDVSGRKDGKATAWLRMVQPYAGSGHGMHFPLHKGTEVLLAFIDGDPDRPIITGAVPNPETPSQVKDANQSQCRITSGGQNKIHMQDQSGAQGIYLSTPTHGTKFFLGATETPPDDGGGGGGDEGGGGDDTQAQIDELKKQNEELQEQVDEQQEQLDEQKKESEEQKKDNEEQKKEIDELRSESEAQADEIEEMKKESEAGEWGVSLFSDKGIKIQAGGENVVILGELTDTVVGGTEYIHLAQLFEFVFGLSNEVVLGGVGSYHWPEKWCLRGSEERVSAHEMKVIGDEMKTKASIQSVTAAKQEVEAQVNQLRADSQNAIGVMSQVTADLNQAIANQNQALGNRIDAVGNKTQALGNHVEALGNTVRSAGNQMVNAGIKMQTAGSDISTSGSRIRSAGSNIANAGMIMRDAPVIMDN